MAGITRFSLDPYPASFAVCLDRKSFNKEIGRLGLTDIDYIGSDHASATTHILTNPDIGLYAIMVIRPWDEEEQPSSTQIAALVAHEAMHIVQHLWEYVGEEKPGQEAEAYLLQHIVQGTLETLKKASLFS